MQNNRAYTKWSYSIVASFYFMFPNLHRKS